MGRGSQRRFTPATSMGLMAFVAAASLSLVDPWNLPGGLVLPTSVLPLVFFVSICFAAPFFPSWGFFLPVAIRGSQERAVVALTFDDGPDPATTPQLLDLLARHGVRAAFFVVGRRAAAYPHLVARIRNAGHEVGNHSMTHDPLLMLRSTAVLEREIADCQRILEGQGIQPLAFRPPVGITNPKLGPVLERLGLGCVCFRCRPADFGNRAIERLGERVLQAVAPGDIVLLHDVAPHPTGSVGEWLAEIDRILDGLKARNLSVVPLSQLLGRPLMAAGPSLRQGPVAQPAPAQASGT